MKQFFICKNLDHKHYIFCYTYAVSKFLFIKVCWLQYLSQKALPLLIFECCTFNIKEVLNFVCLDRSEILSSSNFEKFCFHWLRLDLWMLSMFSTPVVSFLIFLVMRTPIYPVNLFPQSLSIKYESAQWHSEMDFSLANYSRSKLERICYKWIAFDGTDFSNV